MPGPTGQKFRKVVSKVPDFTFSGRQWIIDHVMLPGIFRKHQINVFHRPAGYSVPDIKGVLKVHTVHDLRTLTIGDRYAIQDVDRYKRSLSRADICVVVSECTKADLMKFIGVKEQKIKVVYLAADERFRTASKESIEQTCTRLNIRRPYFFSVGSVPRKNIEGIIRAFAACGYNKHFQLVLCCRTDVPYYSRLCDELGVKEKVVFVNNTNDDDIVALYSGSHCFVFPSLYEGFGLPILEAMQCETPVITSKVSSCPEVAGDAAILVDPGNIQEIAEAMDQIAGNDALRNRLISMGRERAKLFSWEKFAYQMKEIYSTSPAS